MGENTKCLRCAEWDAMGLSTTSSCDAENLEELTPDKPSHTINNEGYLTSYCGNCTAFADEDAFGNGFCNTHNQLAYSMGICRDFKAREPDNKPAGRGLVTDCHEHDKKSNKISVCATENRGQPTKKPAKEPATSGAQPLTNCQQLAENNRNFNDQSQKNGINELANNPDDTGEVEA